MTNPQDIRPKIGYLMPITRTNPVLLEKYVPKCKKYKYLQGHYKPTGY